jgi:hypothetical protein
MTNKRALQWLLVGFLIGFGGSIGCQGAPIVNKQSSSSPRVKRFYQELSEAKQYRTQHPGIEAQPNYKSGTLQ